MKTALHIFSAPVEEMLRAEQTHIPVIEPFGCYGLLSLDDSLPLGEDSGNSHGRMWGLMSCVPVGREGEKRQTLRKIGDAMLPPAVRLLFYATMTWTTQCSMTNVPVSVVRGHSLCLVKHSLSFSAACSKLKFSFHRPTLFYVH